MLVETVEDKWEEVELDLEDIQSLLVATSVEEEEEVEEVEDLKEERTTISGFQRLQN